MDNNIKGWTTEELLVPNLGWSDQSLNIEANNYPAFDNPRDLFAASDRLPISFRNKIFDLETEMLKLPQLELKVKHHFSKGVYARELLIPANVTLIGEIHKFENLNILSKGTMLVTTDEGVKEVSAPFTVVSPAGTKRAAHTLTECVWTTIHGTDERDVDLIKNHFIAANEQEWLEFCNANQLELGLERT